MNMPPGPTCTDENGFYQFANVPNGETYVLCEVVPDRLDRDEGPGEDLNCNGKFGEPLEGFVFLAFHPMSIGRSRARPEGVLRDPRRHGLLHAAVRPRRGPSAGLSYSARHHVLLCFGNRVLRFSSRPYSVP